jgi:spore germination protein YaaH
MIRWKQLLAALLFVGTISPSWAQFSAHEAHVRAFRQAQFRHETQYDSLLNNDPNYQRPISKKCLPRKAVYGWHPAWSGTAYTTYDFPLLKAVSYFGYEVDPGSGKPLHLNQWRETQLVNRAHAGACEADLTAACFGRKALATLLQRPASCQTLQDSLISLLLLKDGDGICLDFEGLAAAQSEAFADFVEVLADTLHRLQPRRNLTVCLPAGADGKAYPAKRLAAAADRFVLLAYSYKGTRVAETGPVAPLAEVRRDVEDCIQAGIPAEKLLLGLPYFGYRWPTNSQDAGIPATGDGELVKIAKRAEASSGMDFGRDDISGLPYWIAKQGAAQLWVDDTSSLSAKLQLVQALNLGGVAIWALGYDHGTDAYWDFLKSNLADCSAEVTASAEVSETQQEIPGSGVTSAERNGYNWLWMVGGGLVAVLIIVAVRKLMQAE